MTTLSEATQDSPRYAQQQRFGLRGLLRVKDGADDDAQAIAVQLRGAQSADVYDKVLGEKRVAGMFGIGALYFGVRDG